MAAPGGDQSFPSFHGSLSLPPPRFEKGQDATMRDTLLQDPLLRKIRTKRPAINLPNAVPPTPMKRQRTYQVEDAAITDMWEAEFDVWAEQEIEILRQEGFEKEALGEREAIFGQLVQGGMSKTRQLLRKGGDPRVFLETKRNIARRLNELRLRLGRRWGKDIPLIPVSDDPPPSRDPSSSSVVPQITVGEDVKPIVNHDDNDTSESGPTQPPPPASVVSSVPTTTSSAPPQPANGTVPLPASFVEVFLTIRRRLPNKAVLLQSMQDLFPRWRETTGNDVATAQFVWLERTAKREEVEGGPEAEEASRRLFIANAYMATPVGRQWLQRHLPKNKASQPQAQPQAQPQNQLSRSQPASRAPSQTPVQQPLSRAPSQPPLTGASLPTRQQTGSSPPPRQQPSSRAPSQSPVRPPPPGSSAQPVPPATTASQRQTSSQPPTVAHTLSSEKISCKKCTAENLECDGDGEDACSTCIEKGRFHLCTYPSVARPSPSPAPRASQPPASRPSPSTAPRSGPASASAPRSRQHSPVTPFDPSQPDPSMIRPATSQRPAPPLVSPLQRSRSRTQSSDAALELAKTMAANALRRASNDLPPSQQALNVAPLQQQPHPHPPSATATSQSPATARPPPPPIQSEPLARSNSGSRSQPPRPQISHPPPQQQQTSVLTSSQGRPRSRINFNTPAWRNFIEGLPPHLDRLASFAYPQSALPPPSVPPAHSGHSNR